MSLQFIHLLSLPPLNKPLRKVQWISPWYRSIYFKEPKRPTGVADGLNEGGASTFGLHNYPPSTLFQLERDKVLPISGSASCTLFPSKWFHPVSLTFSPRTEFTSSDLTELPCSLAHASLAAFSGQTCWNPQQNSMKYKWAFSVPMTAAPKYL